MVRKLMSLLVLCLCALGINAQDLPPVSQFTPLPLDPKVKHGVLPNGLSYYILHNEEPKNRANFYIAQKVGSTLENQDQLGLAHFLEHMAFNGSTHYPGHSMLDYLQSKGIRFGADINAYTGFDETVYNINNVVTTDKNLMDSVLLVLRDWSDGILLEDQEIEAERGVIQEEWRARNSAQIRRYSAVLPKIYQEYQYQQMPIGKMEVVMNFKPEVLREYYKKWYRPDQQGIIIVGDFDADEMERKVKELFSSVVMPKNAAPRNYPEVSDNKEPIFVLFTDPELSSPSTMISFKMDKAPFEYRSTVEMYVGDVMMKYLIANLFNNRLSEFSKDPQCAYSSARVGFGDFWVSKTKDAFSINVIPKQNTQLAVSQAMEIVMRACKTGFTESEYQRVKDDVLSMLEQQYNNRDKQDSENLANEIIRHFIDNNATPGIEAEYQLWLQVLPALPLMAINQTLPEIIPPINMVVVTSIPEKDGFELVAQDVMLKTIEDAKAKEYEPYVDEVITDPLIASLPKPGSINDIKENPTLGVTEYTLSNGVKVVLKTTDFSADDILFTAVRTGGYQIYNSSEATNAKLMGTVFDTSNWGPFDTNKLKKFLSGKRISLNLVNDNATNELSGSSSVKDLETLMQMIYTSFNGLTQNQQMFDVNLEKFINQIKIQETNPNYTFFSNVQKALYGDNPFANLPSAASLEQVNYPQSFDMMKNVLGNAAEYTFFFTGNVDKATIRPLLEQYIATLPVKMKKKQQVVTPIRIVSGTIKDDFKMPMQTPSTHVYNTFDGDNISFNIKNNIMISLLSDVLQIIYTETLREEEGGTYSPQVGSDFDITTNQWQIFYYFITNAEQQASLIKRADVEFENLIKNGASAVNFNKVKEASIKQFEILINKNEYWNQMLPVQYLYPNVQLIDGYEEILRSLTLEEFNSFIKTLYNGKDQVQVVMEGVPVQ